jgi:hypothetical protein
MHQLVDLGIGQCNEILIPECVGKTFQTQVLVEVFTLCLIEEHGAFRVHYEYGYLDGVIRRSLVHRLVALKEKGKILNDQKINPPAKWFLVTDWFLRTKRMDDPWHSRLRRPD